MIFANIPYPHITNINQDTSAVDVMLQQYYLVRETNAFEVLSNNRASPKTIITAAQALDNIMHIGINYCNDVSQKQVESQTKTINWQYPNFEKIEQDVLPIVLVKLILGVMKIHVGSKLLINWNDYVNKYSHAMPKK